MDGVLKRGLVVLEPKLTSEDSDTLLQFARPRVLYPDTISRAVFEMPKDLWGRIQVHFGRMAHRPLTPGISSLGKADIVLGIRNRNRKDGAVTVAETIR